MSCSLWHMTSATLEGFYASEVFVAARNRDDACQTALHAYDGWIKNALKDRGFHPLISDCFPDDEEFDEQAKAKRREFHDEVKAKLTQTTRRGMIFYRG